MKIEIVSTDVRKFNETGFGGVESCYNFYKAVKSKYPAAHFNIIESIEDLKSIVKRKPDFVIFGFKYFEENNERLWMSKYFRDNDIEFMGTLRENLEFDSNKVLAKEKVVQDGIKTAGYFVTDIKNLISEEAIGLKFPLFVKPLKAACSFGVDKNSFVRDYSQLKYKVTQIHEQFSDVSLVEEFLPGREFTVAVIGNKNELEIMPVELGDFSDKSYTFLSREIKVANIEDPRVVQEPELKKVLCQAASKVFKCLHARDFARVDFKLNEKNEPYFLEINMMPGFSNGRSYFPLACEKNSGMNYDDCMIHVCETGLKRAGLK